MRQAIAVCTVIALLLADAGAAQEGGQGPAGPSIQATAPAPSSRAQPSADAICRTVAQSAADNDLPVEFFSRLIWQESRFDPSARSRAGAEGIAQFMPGTALWRGLLDPFEPIVALRESASYLQELRKTFGNLGLAAAAYNAGPGRVSRWLSGRGVLPSETRAYVRLVTGHSADEWAAPEPPRWEGADIPPGVPCTELANLVTAPRAAPEHAPSWAPWGVQLAGNWSQGRVLATYEQIRRKYQTVLGDREPLVLHTRFSGMGSAIRYLVRIGEITRPAAEKLCARLLALGAACVVFRNPPAPS